MLAVYADAKMDGEKEVEIHILVGMWLRAWHLHLRLHSALYKHHWSDPKEIKKLDKLRRDLLQNMDANMHANSRMVRPSDSFLFQRNERQNRPSPQGAPGHAGADLWRCLGAGNPRLCGGRGFLCGSQLYPRVGGVCSEAAGRVFTWEAGSHSPR